MSRTVSADWFVYGEATSLAHTGYRVLGRSAGIDLGLAADLERRANVGQWLHDYDEKPRIRHAYDVLGDGRVAFSLRIAGHGIPKVRCHTYVMALSDFAAISDPFTFFNHQKAVSIGPQVTTLGQSWDVVRFHEPHSGPLPSVSFGIDAATPVMSRSLFLERLRSVDGDVGLTALLAEILELLIRRRNVALIDVGETADNYIRLTWLALPESDRFATSFSTHVVPATSRDYRLSCIPAAYRHETVAFLLGTTDIIPSQPAKLVAHWLVHEPQKYETFLQLWPHGRLSWLEHPTRTKSFSAFAAWLSGESAPATEEDLQKILEDVISPEGLLLALAREPLPTLLRVLLDSGQGRFAQVVAAWACGLEKDTRRFVLEGLLLGLSPAVRERIFLLLYARSDQRDVSLSDSVAPLVSGTVEACIADYHARAGFLATFLARPAFGVLASELAAAAIARRDREALDAAMHPAHERWWTAEAIGPCLQQVLDAWPETVDVVFPRALSLDPAAAATAIEAHCCEREIAARLLTWKNQLDLPEVFDEAIRRATTWLMADAHRPPETRLMLSGLATFLSTSNAEERLIRLFDDSRKTPWGPEIWRAFVTEQVSGLLALAQLGQHLSAADSGLSELLVRSAIRQIESGDSDSGAVNYIRNDLAGSHGTGLRSALANVLNTGARLRMLMVLRASMAIPVYQAALWDREMLELADNPATRSSLVSSWPWAWLEEIAPALAFELARRLTRVPDNGVAWGLLSSESSAAALAVSQVVSGERPRPEHRAAWALRFEQCAARASAFDADVLRGTAHLLRNITYDRTL